MWVIPLFVMHRCLGFKVEHASLVVMAIICVVKMFQCWRNGNCNKLEGLSSWVKHFRDPLKLVLSLKWSESLEPVEKIFIEVYLLTLPCKLDRFIATEKMFTAVKRCQKVLVYLIVKSFIKLYSWNKADTLFSVTNSINLITYVIYNVV